ncbi:MAG: N-acetylglucosamine-6-phosphate deacetylase [Candidatus Dadabacteria bacterium]
MQNIVKAPRIFTGTEWLEDRSVVIEDGHISQIISSSDAPVNSINYENCFLAPAFIDVQVYGAAGKLLAVFPEASTLELMNSRFSAEGTCLFQPTLATNTVQVFRKGIDATREYLEKGGVGVHGLHLEGPWINPVKRGAHIESLIHSPTVEEARELLEYGKGVITMITLAPEVCSKEVIDLVLSYDIVISAGHSNATYAEAMNGFDKGITTVTHLYNAMSPLQHRAPGLTGAAMMSENTFASIIPDGYHVDYTAIALAKRVMGKRLFAITDAVTETSSGYYPHHLAGNKYESSGILSGSALSMYQAFLNLVHEVDIEVEEALRMCSLYPAQVLKCDHLYGKIVPQAVGQLLVLDQQLKLVDIINQ